MVGVATKLAIPEADAVEASRVAALLAARSPSAKGGVFLTNPDGRREYADLSPRTLAVIAAVLERLAENREALIVHDEAELTPEEAAKVLGLSRPLVYQRMDDGRLPFRMVGSHHRVLLRDVLALKPSEERRKTAAQELAEDTDDIEAEHAPSPEGAP